MFINTLAMRNLYKCVYRNKRVSVFLNSDFVEFQVHDFLSGRFIKKWRDFNYPIQKFKDRKFLNEYLDNYVLL